MTKEIKKKAKEIAREIEERLMETTTMTPGEIEMRGDYAEDGALAMAEWLLSHQWVSVDDERPKEGEEVMMAYIDFKGKRRYATGKKMAVGMQVYGLMPLSRQPSVTHWMPIPPIAEEGGEKK